MAQASRTPPRARRGFTLVEVALSVAVALIVIGGTVFMYQAVKDNASSAMARRKVNMGATLVVEYASANFGRFPTSVPGATGGEFSAMYKRKNPEEYNVSPWGGATADTVDGVVELAPISDGTGDPVTCPDKTDLLATDTSQSANVIYVSMSNANYVRLRQLSNPDAYLIKGFVLAIYDRFGQPWFHLVTNK
jgi:prepilin-type N-terminal cleavage/methylation domain-containing protein